MNNRCLLPLFSAVAVVLLVLSPVSAQTPSDSLSDIEKDWIQNHGPVRVSNELSWAPFNFNERGVPAGYSIDCMELAAGYLDIDIEMVTGPSWNEFLTMLDHGEIDAVLNIAVTPQRSENMLFTIPYSQFSLALFTRTGTSRIEDFKGMSGMTIAVPEGFWLEDTLVEYPDINTLTVADTEEAIMAVSGGRADALYDVMPVVQYLSKRLFVTNLQIGGTLNLEDNEQVDLHIAVGKDQEILQGILNKGLSAISAAEFAELRDLWLDAGSRESAAEPEQKVGIRYPILVILGGIVFVVVLIFMLRRIITKVRVLNFQSIWNVSIASLIIFIALVVGLGWITIIRTDRNLREDLLSSMNVVLDATEQSLYVWIENNLQMVKRDAGNSNLGKLTESLLEPSADFDERQTVFRSYISGSLRWLDEEMYQIIGPDSLILVSNESELEGTVSTLSIHDSERLSRAFGGETLLIPCFETAMAGEEPNPLMFFVSPVRDSAGDVVALLARSEGPFSDFSRLVTMGHSGRSGETFAFDYQGRMISQSRFETDLIQMGLLERNQTSVLNLHLRDPGVNLMENEISAVEVLERDYTYMASRALSGISGQSSNGYRDYRGVPVFGVWHWDARHGFGIATEIDIREGLGSYYVIRNSIIVTLAVTVLLAVLVTLVSLIFGEKSNQSLDESRADLENRVNERTSELSQANKNLNNTIEALTHPFYVIDVKTHGVILANQAAIQQGQKGASTCHALTHSTDLPCDSREHRCPMVEVIRTKQPVQVEHIHTDTNGITHHAEVHGYPIVDENNDVVQMIEYSLDITDRKEAEDTTRKHLEELELFNTLTIGREEKMIELKVEINTLHKQLNLPEKYVIVTGNEEPVLSRDKEAENDRQS